MRPQGPLKPITYFSIETCPQQIKDLFGPEQLISSMDQLSLLVRTVCLLPGFFTPLLAMRCLEHGVMWRMFETKQVTNYEEICRALAHHTVPSRIALGDFLRLWTFETHQSRTLAERMLAILLNPIEHTRHFGRTALSAPALVCVERDAAMLFVGLQQMHPDFASRGTSQFFIAFGSARLAIALRNSKFVRWDNRAMRQRCSQTNWHESLKYASKMFMNCHAHTYLTAQEFISSNIAPRIVRLSTPAMSKCFENRQVARLLDCALQNVCPTQ